MTSELERWANPSLIPSKAERVERAALDHTTREARIAGHKLDALAAVSARAMDRSVDLDRYRRHLADGDAVLDDLLQRIEVNYLIGASRIQNSFAAGLDR